MTKLARVKRYEWRLYRRQGMRWRSSFITRVTRHTHRCNGDAWSHEPRKTCKWCPEGWHIKTANPKYQVGSIRLLNGEWAK